MLAVLSPAKSLDLTPAARTVSPSYPALMDHAAALMTTTRGLSQKKIKELMKLSDDLAKLNRDRFQSFELPFTADNATPAAFAFAGDVYRGLEARTLDDDDLVWAQDHLAILSGLFGLLRPLDLIQPYRLEMGTKLKNKRGPNLYKFWGANIATRIRELTETHDDQTLVNLASNEYFKAVDKKSLNRTIVTCIFEDWKEHEDEGRVISFLAKIARGKMARFLVEKRVDRASGLRDFRGDRYRFSKKRSTDDTFIFSRKFVPVSEATK